MKTVNNRYKQALDNNEQFDNVLVNKYNTTLFEYGTKQYEFINGFELNIVLTRNINTNKIKANETFLGIQKDGFDTLEEATDELNELIALRLNILLENNKDQAKKIFKVKQLSIDNNENESR